MNDDEVQPIPYYHPQYVSMPPMMMPFDSCNLCGALVIDKITHGNWHRDAVMVRRVLRKVNA